MTVFPKILALMKAKGMNDVLLTGGGIIPASDMKLLKDAGCGDLFPPGTNTAAISEYIKTWVKDNRSF
jgi:methylmalonyl-CoA mutase C-terminal domain/subunit